MAGARDIKRRIKSIGSTKKITRAMQMVSAVKMRKAQIAAFSSRTYAALAWQIITNLSHKVDPKYHALLSRDRKHAAKVGVILVSSNRGLIGGFNASLIATTLKEIGKEQQAELIAELFVVGKKGRDAMLRLGKTIVAEFTKQDRVIGIEEVMPISQIVVDEYLRGNYSKILIIYTDFISIINQLPKITQLLPLPIQEHKAEHLKDTDKKYHYDYLFEPTPEKVLDYLLPRIIQSQIYQAVLESDASEHSARMVMMKNATDAASDLIEDLTLTYNQLRQANITKELAEITAGRAALE